jgi:hypothetical protein
MTFAAQPCPPAVELSGPPAVVSGLESLLARRGVAVGASAPCAAARAELAIVPDGYTVSIEDSEGRRSDRTVTTLASASTLIETWVRPDLGPLTQVEVSVARTPPAPALSVSLGAAFETSLADDKSIWLGGGASIGVLWGPVWLGGRGRLAREQWAALPNGARASGSDATLLAVVGWPLKFGKSRLVPSLGLGVGWWSSTLFAHDPQEGDQQGESSNSHELRTEVAVALSLPITRRVSAVASLAAEYLPRARRAVEDNAPVETRGYLRVGVGLQVEGP